MIRNKKIAFIGAHMDDLEINAGATIYKLNQNNSVKLITVSDSRFGGDKEVRKKEFCEAMNYLGLVPSQLIFLNFMDTCLFQDLNKIISSLEPHLKGVDYVFTHHPSDSHNDHTTVNQAVIAAARNCPSVLFFQPTWPSGRPTTPFNPDVIFLFSEQDIDKKIKALSFHKSQIVKYGEEYYLNSVKSLCKGNSLLYSGKVDKFAECFEVNRIVEEL